MKFEKANGRWLLSLVETHGLEGAARLHNYDTGSLSSAIESIKFMQSHGKPFHEQMFYIARKSKINESPDQVAALIKEHGRVKTASLLQVSYATFKEYIDDHGLSEAHQPSPVDVDQLRTYLNNGISVFECAERFGVHTNTIYRYMRLHGLCTSPKRPKLSRDLLTAYIQKGLSAQEIATKENIHVQTVYQRLRAEGLTIPTKDKKLTREALKAYLDQNLSAQEIADKENIHVQTVYQRLRAEGLQTPSARRPDHTQLLNAIADLLSTQPDPGKAYRAVYRPDFKKELFELISLL